MSIGAPSLFHSFSLKSKEIPCISPSPLLCRITPQATWVANQPERLPWPDMSIESFFFFLPNPFFDRPRDPPEAVPRPGFLSLHFAGFPGARDTEQSTEIPTGRNPLPSTPAHGDRKIKTLQFYSRPDIPLRASLRGLCN